MLIEAMMLPSGFGTKDLTSRVRLPSEEEVAPPLFGSPSASSANESRRVFFDFDKSLLPSTTTLPPPWLLAGTGVAVRSKTEDDESCGGGGRSLKSSPRYSSNGEAAASLFCLLDEPLSAEQLGFVVVSTPAEIECFLLLGGRRSSPSASFAAAVGARQTATGGAGGISAPQRHACVCKFHT